MGSVCVGIFIPEIVHAEVDEQGKQGQQQSGFLDAIACNLDPKLTCKTIVMGSSRLTKGTLCRVMYSTMAS